MSDKNNKTITVSDLRASIISRLIPMAPQLDSQDRMRIALSLTVDLATVNRYLDERYLSKIKLFELAEKMIEEANKVLALKQQPAEAV